MKTVSALDAADPSRLVAGKAGLVKVAYDIMAANPDMKQSQLVAQAFQAAESLTGLLKPAPAGASTPEGTNKVLITGTDGILRENTVCHHCHRLGHYAKKCPAAANATPYGGRGFTYGGPSFRAPAAPGYGGTRAGPQADRYMQAAPVLALPPPLPN
jgi:hypothetical protein